LYYKPLGEKEGERGRGGGQWPAKYEDARSSHPAPESSQKRSPKSRIKETKTWKDNSKKAWESVALQKTSN